MSDRDWRSSRDARADRSGPNDRSSGGGGRYNRALHRRDDDGDQSGLDSRRHASSPSQDFSGSAGSGGGGGANFYPNDDQGFRPHQRQRFDGGFDPAWQPAPPSNFMSDFGNASTYGMSYPNPQMPYGNNMDPFPPQQQQQQFYSGMQDPNNNNGMPFGMPGFGVPDMQNSGNGVNQTDLLQFLLQQQQHQQQPMNRTGHASPMPDSFYHGNHHYSGSNGNGNDDDGSGVRVPNAAPAATRVLPSVEEFVPVVPKSLLNLVRSGGGGEGAGEATSGTHTASPTPAGAGALILLEAPKIAPEMDRRAREQRRAHISGFPNGTTREELEDYFRLLLPEVRRLKTEREIRQLAEETGLLKDEGEEAVRSIPANANLSNIDAVKDLTLNVGKVKGFSFIELRLADMIDELVEQCQADPQRFLFPSAVDGRSYPLIIRRPRDAVPLTGLELNRVVMIGFPLSMPADTIKPVFESFGQLLAFDVKNGYAYGEFAELRDATDFRADVHGLVLGNSVVVALPLYDWLKALLVREEVDIDIADDDPVSGNYVMKQVRERLPDPVSSGGAGGVGGSADGAGGGGDGLGAGGRSTALVLAEDPAAASLQIMRELLDMSFTLPDMLARFAGLYPHLRPLYGNTQVTLFPTPILVLLNLFDEDELIHDATYSQLLADIEEEVEQYGRVRRLIVPRREARPKLPEAPKPGVDFAEEDVEGHDAAMAAYAEAKKNFGTVLGRFMTRQTHPVWGGYGRVFVEYETVDEAAEAQQQIAGKLFGDRTVVTSFLFPDLMKDEDEEEKEEEKDDAEGYAASNEEGHEDEKQEKDKENEDEEEVAPLEKSMDAEGGGEGVEEGDVVDDAAAGHAEDID